MSDANTVLAGVVVLVAAVAALAGVIPEFARWIATILMARAAAVEAGRAAFQSARKAGVKVVEMPAGDRAGLTTWPERRQSGSCS